MRSLVFPNVPTSARQHRWRALTLGAFSLLGLVGLVFGRSLQANVDLLQFAPADAAAYLELSAPALGFPGPTLAQLAAHSLIAQLVPSLADAVGNDPAVQRLSLVWRQLREPPRILAQVAALQQPRDSRWHRVRGRVYQFGEGSSALAAAANLRNQLRSTGDCCPTVVGYLSASALLELSVNTNRVHPTSLLPLPATDHPVVLVANRQPGWWRYALHPLVADEPAAAAANTRVGSRLLLQPDDRFDLVVHDVAPSLVTAWLAASSQSPHDLADALAVHLPQLVGQVRVDVAASTPAPSSTPSFVLAWARGAMPATDDAAINAVAAQLRRVQRLLVLPDGTAASELVRDPRSVQWQSLPSVPSGMVAQGLETLAVARQARRTVLSNDPAALAAAVDHASVIVACAPPSGSWLLVRGTLLQTMLAAWGLAPGSSGQLIVTPTAAGGVEGCWQ